MLKGIIITGAYIVVVIFLPFATDKVPDDAQGWGSYLGGLLSPVALIWFIATLGLQAKELKAQREQLGLQRTEMQRIRLTAARMSALQTKELKAQREQLDLQRQEMQLSTEVATEQKKIQLKMLKEANSTRFAESASTHTRVLEEYIFSISNILQKKYPNSTKCPKISDLEYCTAILIEFKKSEAIYEYANFSKIEALPFRNFKKQFSAFQAKAKETDNWVYIRDEHVVLWTMVNRFMANQK